jgi:hypothetical protein
MAEVSLNLHPFTLKPQDEISKWEVLYPGNEERLKENDSSLYKRCSICKLRYKREALTKSIPTRLLQ